MSRRFHDLVARLRRLFDILSIPGGHQEVAVRMRANHLRQLLGRCGRNQGPDRLVGVDAPLAQVLAENRRPAGRIVELRRRENDAHVVERHGISPPGHAGAHQAIAQFGKRERGGVEVVIHAHQNQLMSARKSAVIRDQRRHGLARALSEREAPRGRWEGGLAGEGDTRKNQHPGSPAAGSVHPVSGGQNCQCWNDGKHVRDTAVLKGEDRAQHHRHPASQQNRGAGPFSQLSEESG